MGRRPAVAANSVSSGDRNCNLISKGHVDSTAPVAASVCPCIAGSLGSQKEGLCGLLMAANTFNNRTGISTILSNLIPSLGSYSLS
jgi:hypothetical protein